MSELSQQELRCVQLSILDRVDSFCRREGLTYHLAAGTLLGAVRHGGYIPWDDDIDLTMPREDYARFCREFAAEHPDLDVGAPGTASRPWPYPYAKVSDTRTVLIEDTDLDHAIGVNIDIFPLDRFAPRPVARFLHRAVIGGIKSLLVLKGLRSRPGRGRAKSVALAVAKPVARAIPTDRLVNAIERIALRYAGRSTRLGVIVGSYVWHVDQSEFADPVEIDFEGRRCLAPSGHHEVLSAIYGADYMVPPPEHLRRSDHSFEARWKAPG